MSLALEFRTWSLAPGRTADELFTVELLLERARLVWGLRHREPDPAPHAEHVAHQERRAANPAYRPRLDRARLDRAVEVWAALDALESPAWDDRPVRDLSALRFFPHLTTIRIGCELADLAPLAALRGLRRLELRDDGLTDFDALSGLPALEKLDLRLGAPWPELRAIATLPALRELNFAGNLLAWREVAALPGVEQARFECHLHGTPLRDLRDLPAMPRLRRLKVAGSAQLRGADRYPQLRALEIAGPFADLAPLAGLPDLLDLSLRGERFFDLAPLAGLPRLRRLTLDRERGLDLTPLADCPRLCDVRAPRCRVLGTELGSLNAALRLPDAEFLAPVPRALAPLRVLTFSARRADWQSLPAADPAASARAIAYGDDPVMRDAEAAWFGRELRRRLDALLGPGWGLARPSCGHAQIVLPRFQDASRVEDIVAALRGVSAAARFPCSYLIGFQPHGDLSEEIAEAAARLGGKTEDDDARSLERRIADLRAFREGEKARRAFLEREHQWRLRQQEGRPIEDPEEFAEPLLSPSPTADGTREASEANEDDDGDEAASLGEELSFYLEVDENFLWVREVHLERARPFLPGEPEDWHALPEPPQSRPRPP
ncbi:MAG: hypothetical protein RLZZ15_4309 [Verrucomicrobiota bacterium]|jgi:hypothetical protein